MSEDEENHKMVLLRRPIRDVDDSYLQEVYNVLSGASPLPVQGFEYWDGRGSVVRHQQHQEGGNTSSTTTVPTPYFNLYDPDAYVQKQSFLLKYHRPTARLLRSEGATFVPHSLSTTVASCHPVASVTKVTPRELLLPSLPPKAEALRRPQGGVADFASPSAANAVASSSPPIDVADPALTPAELRQMSVSATNPIAVVAGMLFHNDTKSFLFQQAPFVYNGCRKVKCLLHDVDLPFVEGAALQMFRTGVCPETGPVDDSPPAGPLLRRIGASSSECTRELPAVTSVPELPLLRVQPGSDSRPENRVTIGLESPPIATGESCAPRRPAGLLSPPSTMESEGQPAILAGHPVPPHIAHRMAREVAAAEAKARAMRGRYCGERLRVSLEKEGDRERAQMRELSRIEASRGGARTVQYRATIPPPPPPTSSGKVVDGGRNVTPRSAAPRKYVRVRDITSLTGALIVADAEPPTTARDDTTIIPPPKSTITTAPPPKAAPPAHLIYKRRRHYAPPPSKPSTASPMGESASLSSSSLNETGPLSSRASTAPASSGPPQGRRQATVPTEACSRRLPSTSNDSYSPMSPSASPDGDGRSSVSHPSRFSYDARVVFQIEEFEAVVASTSGLTTPWVVQTIRLLRQGGSVVGRPDTKSAPLPVRGRRSTVSSAGTNSSLPPLAPMSSVEVPLDCVGPIFVRAFVPQDHTTMEASVVPQPMQPSPIPRLLEIEALPSESPSREVSPPATAGNIPDTPSLSPKLVTPISSMSPSRTRQPIPTAADLLLGGGSSKGRLMLSTLRNPISGEEALKTNNAALYQWCLQRDPKELGAAVAVLCSALKYFKHTFNVVRTVKRLSSAIKVMQRFVRRFLSARTRAINYMLPLWDAAEARCADRLLNSTQHLDTAISAAVFSVIAKAECEPRLMPPASDTGSSHRGSMMSSAPPPLPPLVATQVTPAVAPSRPGAVLQYVDMAPSAMECLLKAEAAIVATQPTTIAGRREATERISALHDRIVRESKVEPVDLLVRSAIAKRLITPTAFKVALLQMLWAKRRSLCKALQAHFQAVLTLKNEAMLLLRSAKKSHGLEASQIKTGRVSGSASQKEQMPVVDVVSIQAAQAVLAARDPVETIPAKLWSQIQLSGAAGGYLLANIKRGLQLKASTSEAAALSVSAEDARFEAPSRETGSKHTLTPPAKARLQETKEERTLGLSNWNGGGTGGSLPLFGFPAKVFQTLQADARHEVGLLTERQSAAIEWISRNFQAAGAAASPAFKATPSSRVSFASSFVQPNPTPPIFLPSALITLPEPHATSNDIERLLVDVQSRILQFRDFYTAAELSKANLILMAASVASTVTGASGSTSAEAGNMSSPRSARHKGAPALRAVRSERSGFNSNETLVGLFLSQQREGRVLEASPQSRRKRVSILLSANDGPSTSAHNMMNTSNEAPFNMNARREFAPANSTRDVQDEIENPFAFTWYFNVNDLVREALAFISEDLSETERSNGLFTSSSNEQERGDATSNGRKDGGLPSRVPDNEERERAAVRFALNGRKGVRGAGGASEGSILRHPMIRALIVNLPTNSHTNPSNPSSKKKPS